MARRLSKEEYMARLPESCLIKPVGDIQPQNKPTKWVCEFGHTFDKRVGNMISHPFCPLCNPSKTRPKYSLDDVVGIYKEHGYLFKDCEYLGNKHPHNVECIKCGAGSTKKLNQILTGRTGCRFCGNFKKITQERMDSLLSERGYTSWSGSVRDGWSSLTVYCERGDFPHMFEMSCRDLLAGNNCPYCSDRYKKDSKTVNMLFKAYNMPYEVIGDYLGSHTTQDYKCLVCNTVFSGLYKSIKSGKRSCPTCYPTQRGKAFNENGVHILYYLKVDSEQGTLFKIGVTGRSVEERFTSYDLERITVLKTMHFDTGEEAYRTERELLLKYSDFKYAGGPVLSSGNTEIFTYDILGLDTLNQKPL